jgi:hypothetical protein
MKKLKCQNEQIRLNSTTLRLKKERPRLQWQNAPFFLATFILMK